GRDDQGGRRRPGHPVHAAGDGARRRAPGARGVVGRDPRRVRAHPQHRRRRHPARPAPGLPAGPRHRGHRGVHLRRLPRPDRRPASARPRRGGQRVLGGDPMLTYTTFEIRRTLRNIPFALYTIIFPAGFYLLFTVVFGGASQHSYAAHYMVSMALYGTIGAGLTGIGTQIAFERRGGWTRQLTLTPLRPVSYLAIKVGSALI